MDSIETTHRRQALASVRRKIAECRREQRMESKHADEMRRAGYVEYREHWIAKSERAGTWDFWHDAYDGPEDDRRGNEPTIEACKERIDDLIADESERTRDNHVEPLEDFCTEGGE